MKKIIILFGLLFTLLSCKKETIQLYDEKPSIYFNLNVRSFYNLFPGSSLRNVLVDFAPDNSNLIRTDTLNFLILVTGPLFEEDRPFILEKLQVENNMSEDEYEFIDDDFVIPAGEVGITKQLVIHRSNSMQNTQKVLALRLSANEHFKLGANRDTIGFTGNNNTMRITHLNVTAQDILEIPENWESFLQEFFGRYSRVKHRFIIDILNEMTIPSTVTRGSMTTRRNRLRTALASYNLNNPVLTDENGLLVTF